jgi:hypothetical protein
MRNEVFSIPQKLLHVLTYVWEPSNETAVATHEAMHYIGHTYYILVITADILRMILT